MEPVTTIVAKAVINRAIGQAGICILKKIWQSIFPPKSYITKLSNIINETISEYETNHPYDKYGNNFSFYHSQIVFEKLLTYTFFDHSHGAGLQFEFEKNPLIIVPTEQELKDFLDSFIKKIKANDELKKLFIQENYQVEIFNISQHIRDYLQEKKKKELTQEKVIEALKEQVKRQLDKQRKIGKYIPQTFIENSGEKDLLRYACHPVLFFQKEFEEINSLDFRRLNLRLKEKNLEGFNIDFKEFKEKISSLTLDNFSPRIQELRQYLSSKDEELRSISFSSNEKYKFETKLSRKKDLVPWFTYNKILITETAGQGKTNFLCDFADRFLLKRDIPATFLTASELDSNNIAQSIVSRIFPFKNVHSFEDVLEFIGRFCQTNNCLYVINIDGLNENPNINAFAKAIEQFLLYISKYSFVRVILTCRTEYFEQNFPNLKFFLKSCEMGRINSLNKSLSDSAKEKLYNVYLKHFNIEIEYISNKAYEQLIDNFLLLRIFAETYSNQNNLEFDNIYKNELFEKYYEKKYTELTERLEHADFGIKGKFNIQNFLSVIIEYMVTHSQYSNIPISAVIDRPENREICIKFLDENILIRRDINPVATAIFENQDVVNFTFDEFRDYLLSRYLIDVLYKKSEINFNQFLESNLTETSPIYEGCRTFLFYYHRFSNDTKLNKIIQQQKWYDKAFIRGIFEIRDEQVTAQDIQYLKKLFYSSTEIASYIVQFVIYRRFDCQRFKNLSIDFLFSLLLEMDEETYNKFFYPVFLSNRIYYRESPLDNFINQLEKMIEECWLEKEPQFHPLFHLLIYFFSKHDLAKYLYERYRFQYPESSKKQLMFVLESKNLNLVSDVKLFMKRYEITI